MSQTRKKTEKILSLSSTQDRIRNIGLIGHIDHGKTTLSDSLLAKTGLLAKSLAGEARVLDYLQDEQKRGITMKSANISLYYTPDPSDKADSPDEVDEKTSHGDGDVERSYLINLVDTPGHLDFSGKVSRALRLIDGVIVIVDAVEEISSQTETVMRQAMEEAVQPILFINKIDRLFKEIKLDLPEVKQKLSRIISNFNKLIYMSADDEFKEKWQVSLENGSVLFGSALHRWGASSKQMIETGKSFDYIQKKYESNGNPSILEKTFPVWKCVLDSIVNILPNPVEAQRYRIEKIWSGDVNSKVGKAMVKCDIDGPLVVGLSKVQRISGRLIGTGRIYSGKVGKKEHVWLVNENKKGQINSTNLFMGSRLMIVDSLPAGNIVAIGGVDNMKSGETLYDAKVAEDETPSPFEHIKYVSEPVVCVAIEPELLRDLKDLEGILEDIVIEDPNISVQFSEDTGEVLVSGMGPLHLEIVAKTIKERGIPVSVSDPTSIFYESIQSKSSIHSATSPNGENLISLSIDRIDNKSINYLRNATIQNFGVEQYRIKEFENNTNLTKEDAQKYWHIDHHHNLVLYEPALNLDAKNTIKRFSKSFNELIKIIENTCKNGKLTQEPYSELKITIHALELNSDPEISNYFEISTMFQNAMMACISEAGTHILEPIYNLSLTTPEEYIGVIFALINQSLGKIGDTTQDAYYSYIKAKMSVRKSIDFVKNLRDKTSGRVFWQMIFDRFAPIPESEAESIISDIKFNKGFF